MTCPVCSAEARPAGEKARVPLGRCAACGHLFSLRQPSAADLKALYADYAYGSLGSADIPPFVAARLDEVARGFASFRRTNRALDVGFGAGLMLGALKRAGWEEHGIETSRLALELARKAGFSRVLEGENCGDLYPAGHFDVIVASELIEHVPFPADFLREAAGILRPGGLLYLTTPNSLSLTWRCIGNDWSVVAPKEHLHLFSRTSLSKCLIANGFQCDSLVSEGFNPHEVLNKLRRKQAKGVAETDRNQTGYAINQALSGNLFGQAAKAIANRILSVAGIGDTLKAHCKRL